MARRISDQERIITFFQTADRVVVENTLEIVRVIVKNRFADQERRPRAGKGLSRKRAGEEAGAGEGAARAAKSGEGLERESGRESATALVEQKGS